MDILNVGCGGRPNAEWTNLDLMGPLSYVRHRVRGTLAPNFVRHRLPGRLPFADASFDGIYCAQVIEHFDQHDGLKVLSEFRRVLRPGGVARVIVPDLEVQCETYLDALRAVRSDPSQEERYRFAKLWLLDQMVRTTPGGLLSGFSADVRDAELRARYRLGGNPPSRLMQRVPSTLRKMRVQHNGELHRWAYDERDLQQLAAQAGFGTFDVATFDRSKIDAFVPFDRDAAGELQPGSIYAELIV